MSTSAHAWKSGAANDDPGGRMMKRPRRLLGIAVAAVLLGAIYLMLPRLLICMFAWLDVGSRPQRSDCVLVLGGDVSTRPFVAAALVKVGLAPKVLLTHAARHEDDENILAPEDEIAREVLLRRGVPKESIEVIGDSCEHTEAEAHALENWLESAPRARVAVVTNGWHTRRARWVFRLVLGDAAEQVSFVSAPSDISSDEHWWRDEATLVAVLEEYLKLVFYFVYYGQGRYWIMSVVALAAALLVWRKCCLRVAVPR